MSSNKLNSYRIENFSQQTPTNELFTFKSVPDLIYDISTKKDIVLRCRTLGVMKSENGHFFLIDIDQSTSRLLISMKYYKGNIPSCVLPNTVQMFGTVQWKEKPIFFVKILQVLNPPMAVRLKKAVTAITDRHLAQIK